MMTLRSRFAASATLAASLFALCASHVAFADDMSPAPKDQPPAPKTPAEPAPTCPMEPGKGTAPTPPADASKPSDAPTTEGKPSEVAAAPAPEFTLKDLDGKDHKLADYRGKWVVIEWINPSCPFVKKFYEPGAMQALQKKYADQGVVWLSVCSTAAAHKNFMTPEQWKASVSGSKSVPTAVLLDTDGAVGKLYGAKTTPDMRVICPKGTLRYSGALDSDAGGKTYVPTARNYVAEVLDAALAGKDPTPTSNTPYGCSIKYAQ